MLPCWQSRGFSQKKKRKKSCPGLQEILVDIENGKLEFSPEYEDIHSFVEANLIARKGNAGKKLHTGRSRNDQVALDMKMYVREEIQETDGLLKELLETLHKLMKENIHTYMPGFTHLQKAQPVTVAHHLGAYFEMFKRDRSRLTDTKKRTEFVSPRKWSFGRYHISIGQRIYSQGFGL